MNLSQLIPGLADGYRERYVARGLACEVCGAGATHGKWHDNTETGELRELPLCDEHRYADSPWEPA